MGSRTGGDRQRRVLDAPAWLTLLLFALLAAVMNRPLSVHPQRMVADSGDAVLTSWILSWDCYQLLGGEGRLFDANIFHPRRNTLAYSEHLLGEAIWVWPLYLAGWTPAGINNAVLLLAFVLNGWVTFLVVRALFHSAAAGVVAGCLYAYNPFRYCQLGHVQVEFVFWLPALAYFLIRYGQEGKTSSAFGAAVCYWQQAWSNNYLLVYLFYPTGLVFLWLFVRWCRRRERFLWSHLLGWALVAVPLLFTSAPYWTLKAQGGLGRSVGEAEHFSANLFSYLSAPPPNRLYGGMVWAARRGGPGAYLFPGLVAVGLFLIGGWELRKRRGGSPLRTPVADPIRPGARIPPGALRYLWLAALVTMVLAMGPSIHIASEPVLPGPAYILHKLIPGFEGLRASHRWHLVTVALLVFPAAHGFLILRERLAGSRLGRGGLRAATVLTPLAILAEGYSAPLPRHELHPDGKAPPPVYGWLGAEPGSFAVIEYPIGRQPKRDLRYMYYSRYHWKRLVNGRSGTIPPGRRQLLRRVGNPTDPKAVGWFRRHNVRLLILHEDQFPGQQTGARLRERLAVSPNYSPAGHFGADSVWELVPAGEAAQERVTPGGG